jgi:hypothetical protein
MSCLLFQEEIIGTSKFFNWIYLFFLVSFNKRLPFLISSVASPTTDTLTSIKLIISCLCNFN